MVKKTIERVIFSSRWFLVPFYLGLMLALICYGYVFAREEIHIIMELKEFSVNQALLGFLELLDITMIANLIKMIITGSYNSFISKDHGYASENISSGMLKTKMGTSLVGVSSIHLLQVFINSQTLTMDDLVKKLLIHFSFLIGAGILAWIEYLHVKSEVMEHSVEHQNKQNESKESVTITH